MNFIAEDPNYFGLIAKSHYMTDIMVENLPIRNQKWFWRISSTETSSYKHCIVHRKYEPRAEEICTQLLYIDVSLSKFV